MLYDYTKDFRPKWYEWPKGDCAWNVHPDTLECPVCGTPLRTVEVICSFCDGTLYKAVCTHCETFYTYQSSDDIPVVSTDELSIIDTLQEKLAQLQLEIDNLKKKHSTYSPTPKVCNNDNPNVPENIRYLLS